MGERAFGCEEERFKSSEPSFPRGPMGLVGSQDSTGWSDTKEIAKRSGICLLGLPGWG